MRYLESNSQRQKAGEGEGAGEKGMRSRCLMGTESQSGEMKFWKGILVMVAQLCKLMPQYFALNNG